MKNISFIIKNVTITMLIAILMLLSTIIFAEDEVKFPGKISVEYKVQLDSDSMDGKPVDSLDGDVGDLYLRNEFKGKVQFKPTKFYSITPWLKDRIDMKFYQTGTAKQPDIKMRNRFYFGLDNTFSIMDVMDIGVNYELRLENSIEKNRIEVRHTPILALSGEYDFGLSWEMKNMFEFYQYPSSYTDPAEDRLFQKFSYELDTLNIQFEFFHFFAPKKMKGAIEADIYILSMNLSGLTRYDAVVNREVLDILEYAKLFVGLNFDFWGVKPFVGFYGMWVQYDAADAGRVADFGGNRQGNSGLYTQFLPGIKAGLKFKKDNLELGFTYTGVVIAYDSYDSSANFDDDLDDSLTELMDKNANALYKFWENHISCYAKLKF